jgi:ribosomal protein S18 acetylase RimI-like enzyme
VQDAAAFLLTATAVFLAYDVAMWRIAEPTDDDSVIAMCLQLYLEDPGPMPVSAEHMRTTLAELRRSPFRGRVVVLEAGEELAGYALLIAFWSNELGGEICEVDEIFVLPEHRGRGFASSLFAAIAGGELLSTRVPAIELIVTLANSRARRLYERVGFREIGVSMVRRTA